MMRNRDDIEMRVSDVIDSCWMADFCTFEGEWIGNHFRGRDETMALHPAKKPGSLLLDILFPDPRSPCFGDLYEAYRKGIGDDARVAWRVPEPGTVNVMVIDRGTLPKGFGGSLLAEALTQSRTRPTKRLAIEEIVNQPTVDAYARGFSPEATVLGKTAMRALAQMGLSPKCSSWNVGPSGMKIVIDIEDDARVPPK